MDVTAGEPRRRPLGHLSAKRPWIALLVLLLAAGAIWGAYALTQASKSGGPGAFGRRGGRPPATVGVAQALSALSVTAEDPELPQEFILEGCSNRW